LESEPENMENMKKKNTTHHQKTIKLKPEKNRKKKFNLVQILHMFGGMI
jgi:hypothetical protein